MSGVGSIGAGSGLTVLVEDGEHDVDDVIGQLNVSDSLCDVLERRLIDRRSRDVVERQRRVDVVDVVQKVEEVEVFLQRNAPAVVAEALLHALHLLRLLLVRVAGVCQQQFSEIALRNVAILVRVLPFELQREDFTLQVLLKLQELLDRQLLVHVLAEEIRCQGGVDSLPEK